MSTIFYVAVNGNDATALINDPTHPYTLAGILGLIAAQQPQGIVSIILTPGTYKFECPRQVLIGGNVQFYGSNPNDVIIYAGNILCTNGRYATFSNLTLISCGGQNMISLDSSTLTLSNVNIVINEGTFFTGNDGNLTLNNVNLQINAPKAAFMIDGSTCGLNIFNSTIDVKFNYPIATNVAIIGRKTALGYINVYNVLTNVTLNGGTRSVIAYYNTNNVSHSDFALRGTNVEGAILVGVDIQPASSSAPFVYIDIQAAIKDVGATFSIVNVNNYPVTMQDINWMGQNRSPNPYPVVKPPVQQTTTAPSTNPAAPATNSIKPATASATNTAAPRPSIIQPTRAIPSSSVPTTQLNQVLNRGYNPTGMNTYTNPYEVDGKSPITGNMIY